jgi:hypothetical protein
MVPYSGWYGVLPADAGCSERDLHFRRAEGVLLADAGVFRTASGSGSHITNCDGRVVLASSEEPLQGAPLLVLGVGVFDADPA